MNLTNVRLPGPWVATLDKAENTRTEIAKVSALVGYGITRVLTCPGAQAGPRTPDIIDHIAAAGVFVVPCVVLNASMMGINAAEFAADHRVHERVDEPTLRTLKASFNRYPQGNLDDVLATVAAPHAGGVDIVTGTDASITHPSFGGLAHGASVPSRTPDARPRRPQPHRGTSRGHQHTRPPARPLTAAASSPACAPTCYSSTETPRPPSATPSTYGLSGGAGHAWTVPTPDIQ